MAINVATEGGEDRAPSSGAIPVQIEQTIEPTPVMGLDGNPVDMTGVEDNEYIDFTAPTPQQAIRRNMLASQEDNSGRVARVQKMYRETSLPMGLIDSDLEELEKAAKPRLDPDALVAQNPQLGNWLGNPDNYALAKDDIAAIERLSRGVKMVARKPEERADKTLAKYGVLAPFASENMSNAYDGGMNGLEAGSLLMAASFGHIKKETAIPMIAEARRRQKENQAKAPDYKKEFDATMADKSKSIQQNAERWASSFGQLKEGKILDGLKSWFTGETKTVGDALDMMWLAMQRPRGTSYAVVENLPNVLPSMTLGAAGALGGPAASLGGMFMGGLLTEVAAQTMDSLEKRGFDSSSEADLARALSDPKLVEEFQAEALRKGLTTATVDMFFNAFAGRMLSKLPKSATAGQKLGTAAIEGGVQGLGEGVSEGAGDVARAKGDVKKMDFGGWVMEMITSFGQSVSDIATGVEVHKPPSVTLPTPEGGPPPSDLPIISETEVDDFRAKLDPNTAKAAEELTEQTRGSVETLHQAQALQEAMDAVKEIKNVQQVPGKIAEIVDEVTGGKGASNVLFQKDEWDEYWNGQGLSPAKAAEQITGDPYAYHEAEETGTPIQIPMGQFVEKLALTEHGEKILAITRTESNGQTFAEALENIKQLPVVLNQLAQEATEGKKEDGPAQELAKIAKDKTDSLIAQGRPADEAKKKGEDWAELVRVQSGIMEESPADWLARYPLLDSPPGQLSPGDGEAHEPITGPEPHVLMQLIDASDRFTKKNLTAAELAAIEKEVDEINKANDLADPNRDQDVIDNNIRRLDELEAILERDSPIVGADGGASIISADDKRQEKRTAEWIKSSKEAYEREQSAPPPPTPGQTYAVVYKSSGKVIQGGFSSVEEARTGIDNSDPKLQEMMEVAAEAPKDTELPMIDRFKARFSGEPEVVAAIDKAQDPKKGPYVSDPAIPGIGWAPNYAAEPTGTIGPARISQPNSVVGNWESGSKFTKDETDPFKWAEDKYGVTRQLIEKHKAGNIPLTINTSSDFVARTDIIESLPKDAVVNMYLLPPVDGKFNSDDGPVTNRNLFPGNPSRKRQESAVEALRQAGIAVNVIEPTVEQVIKAAGGKKVVAKKLGVKVAEVDTEIRKAMGQHLRLVGQGDVLYQSGEDDLSMDVAPFGGPIEGNLDPKIHDFQISVKSSNGNEIGLFSFFHEGGSIFPYESFVNEDQRRKGIATAAYDKAEELSGKELKPSTEAHLETESVMTPDAEKFWEDRKKNKSLKQDDGKIVRGQIEFLDDKAIQTFFEGQNVTTSIHEGFHYLLKRIRQDYESLKARPDRTDKQLKFLVRVDAMLKFAGADSWANFGTKENELVTRGFEQFMREGKAPVPELQSLFTRFKVWFVNIYKRAEQLNVTLTPEVRDFYSRLYATQEEIDAAEAALKPITADPYAFGFTGDKAERYITAREEARTAAENELDAQLQADFKRQQTAVYKEQRRQVKEEVQAQVDKMPVYAAISLLKEGAETNGVPFKIDRAQVDKELAKQLPRGVMSPKGEPGIHPDIAAELLGFPSGEDLVSAMANAIKQDDLVEQITTDRMNNEHGDLLTDEKLPEAALQAIHNDKRALLLRMELEHLAGNDLPVLKDVAKKVAKRVPSEKAIREQATRTVARMQVGDIKPHKFQRAEVKSAKDAAEAFARGDMDAAFEAKRRELLNHELYRAAVAAQEKVDKSMERFKRVAQSDEKISKSRDVNLVSAARSLLAQFGIGKEGKTPESYLEQIKAYDPGAYDTLKAMIDSLSPVVGPVDSLSFDDFVALSDTVDALWSLAKSKMQMEIEGKNIEFNAVKDELMAKLEARTTGQHKKLMTESVPDSQETKLGFLGFVATTRRVEHWALAMDDGEHSGAFTKYIWRPVSEAADRFRADKQKYLKKVTAILKTIASGIDNKPIDAKELGYKFKNGKAEVLGALLHIGNQSNKTKLLVPFGWGQVDDNGILDSRKWDQFFDRMQTEGVITKADMDAIQALWDLFEETKPMAQQVHKKLFGHYFGEVSAEPVKTQFGTYRGGYAPAKADPMRSFDGAMRQDQAAVDQNYSFQYPTAGRGHTKKRIENYAVPLIMDLRLVPTSLDAHLRFIHMEAPVKQVARLLLDREFRASLTAYDQVAAQALLIPWAQRSAQQRTMQMTASPGDKGLDKVFIALRQRAGMAVMFANVANSIQNLTGFSVANSRVGHKYLRNGIWNFITNRKQMVEWVAEKSTMMKQRMDNQSMEMQAELDKILLDQNAYQKAKQWTALNTYFLQAAIQNMVDTPVWSGAFEQAVAKGMSDAEAVKFADATIRQTQGSNNPEDVSARDAGTPAQRLFSLFTGYFNMQANLLGTESIVNYQKTGSKKVAAIKTLPAYMAIVAIPSIMTAMLMQAAGGKLDDDDDDEYMDDVMSMLLMSQVKGITGMIPIAGPFIQLGMNQFNDKKYDDRLSNPISSMIDRAYQAGTSVPKALFDDGSQSKAVKDAFSLITLATGLPFAAAAKPLGYLLDLNQGKTSPTGPIDFTRGLLTGRPGANATR